VQVGTPAPCVAGRWRIAGTGACDETAERNVLHFCGPDDRFTRKTALRTARSAVRIALPCDLLPGDLPRLVATPTTDKPVRVNGTGVMIPGGDVDHAGQTSDLYGGEAEGERSIPQLSVVVGAPALDGTVGKEGTGVA
jgi:hypothetical protein